MGIRRTLAALLAVPALAAALWFGAGPGHADEQGTLAGIISWALSTPENRVTVGAVEGALSSDAVIRDLRHRTLSLRSPVTPPTDLEFRWPRHITFD